MINFKSFGFMFLYYCLLLSYTLHFFVATYLEVSQFIKIKSVIWIICLDTICFQFLSWLKNYNVNCCFFWLLCFSWSLYCKGIGGARNLSKGMQMFFLIVLREYKPFDGNNFFPTIVDALWCSDSSKLFS